MTFHGCADLANRQSYAGNLVYGTIIVSTVTDALVIVTGHGSWSQESENHDSFPRLIFSQSPSY